MTLTGSNAGRGRLRHAKGIRIYCPVSAPAFEAGRQGDGPGMEEDEAVAAMLGVIRGPNPLGDFGLYGGVVEMSLGIETFVPSSEAAPVMGRPGGVSHSPTIILTTFVDAQVPDEDLEELYRQLLEAHPWEVPVIEIFETGLLMRG